MIIYGWNTKNIKQAPLEGYECTQCAQKQSVIAIFAHYVHVFWIPFFPYKKSAYIVCTNCQVETTEDVLDSEKKTLVKQLKSAVPIPKYMFAGLMLLVIGIGALMYSNNRDKSNELTYLENPQIGDVYVLKNMESTDEYNHYLLKVNDVVDDSLWVSFTSYSYNGVVTQLEPEDGFYDIMYPMHKDGVKAYKASGELKKVIRNYTTSAGFDRIVPYVASDSLVLEE